MSSPITTTASSPAATGAGPRYFTRFTPVQVVLHAVLVVTFLGLAATGLALRFSGAAWSKTLANGMGGFPVLLFFHKFLAVALTVDFMYHVADIAYRVVVKKQFWMLWGPNSLVPNLNDIQQFFGQIRWFLFMGPQPKFDRFTYWEKLDYWGVFWGMAVIGISGYAMWFAPLFARLVPGSWLNVALLIHGEEALLAVSYIFVVHFFNEHLRPQNFPMDLTIFTGRQSEVEFAERHPEEYARLQKSGELESLKASAPTQTATRISYLGGAMAIVIGIALMVLTVEAFLSQ